MNTNEITKRTPRNRTLKQHKKLLKNRSERNKKNVNARIHMINSEKTDKRMMKKYKMETRLNKPMKRDSQVQSSQSVESSQRVLKHSS